MKEHSSSRSTIAIGVSLLAAATLLFVVLGSAPNPDSDWAFMADRILSGSFQGEVSDPLPVARNPRRQAVYFALLIAGLLSFLYGSRRKRYIALWVAAWVMLAVGGYLVSRSYATGGGARFGMGLLQLSKVSAALLLLRSAHLFRGSTPLSRNDWVLLPGLTVWLVIVGGRLSAPLALGPAYLLTGLIHLRAASVFGSRSGGRRLLGAVLLSASLGVVGLSNAVFGVTFGTVLANDRLMLLFLNTNSLAFLVAAFAMHMLVLQEVVDELKRANARLKSTEAELRRLATTDALTGCHNRHFLETHVGPELERHRRYETPMSLLFVDIDHFKSINDSHGHETGDRLLRSVGQYLKRQVRENDHVVRWGGDEFVVLMTCSGEEALAKARALTESFDAAIELDLPSPGPGLSIGHVEIPPETTDILPFVHLADRDMYAKKRAAPTID